MATPPNDDTKMLMKLLADGQWHDYEDIRDRVAQAVPPGRALRKYQERIESARRQKNNPDYDTDASEDARIYYGARACAQTVITSWKDRGIEYSGTRANRKIRVRPGFRTWGVEVAPPTPEVPEVQNAPEMAPAEAEEADLEPVSPQGYDPTEVEVGVPEIDFSISPPPVAVGPPKLSVPKPGPPPVPSPPVREAVECEECSQLVGNIKNHRRWHRREREAREATPPVREEMALFAESEIRSLVQGIVKEELDKFQVGMQAWLANQFVQVEAAIRTAQHPVSSWSSWRQ
jgi:hypothetical protein